MEEKIINKIIELITRDDQSVSSTNPEIRENIPPQKKIILPIDAIVHNLPVKNVLKTGISELL